MLACSQGATSLGYNQPRRALTCHSSCIGVIFLVLALELLRRLGKEYDRYLIQRHKRHSSERALTKESSDSDNRCSNRSKTPYFGTVRPPVQRRFKPNALQQLTRALLHMLQFGVAYFIMLLAMYYNGYIIICILIGAFLGSFLFSWETMGSELGSV